jgi:hypothetical protein
MKQQLIDQARCLALTRLSPAYSQPRTRINRVGTHQGYVDIDRQLYQNGPTARQSPYNFILPLVSTESDGTSKKKDEMNTHTYSKLARFHAAVHIFNRRYTCISYPQCSHHQKQRKKVCVRQRKKKQNKSKLNSPRWPATDPPETTPFEPM